MDRQARKLQAQRDSEATVAAVAAAAASKDAPGGEVVATVAPVIKLSDDEDDDEDGGCGAVGEEGAAGERQVGGATTTSATRCRRSALEMMIGADCSNYPSEEVVASSRNRATPCLFELNSCSHSSSCVLHASSFHNTHIAVVVEHFGISPSSPLGCSLRSPSALTVGSCVT